MTLARASASIPKKTMLRKVEIALKSSEEIAGIVGEQSVEKFQKPRHL